MSRIIAMSAALLIVASSAGCSTQRTQIYVQTSPMGVDGVHHSESKCIHGHPLAANGLVMHNPFDNSTASDWVNADVVGLTTLGPAQRPMNRRPGVFYLGAGDSLGQNVFGTYAMFARAERAREMNEPEQVIVSGEPVGE